MEHNSSHDVHMDVQWGGWTEVAFWTAALLVNGLFIVYAAWRLAVRHTEATGSSVLVAVKQKTDDPVAASSSSSAVPSARRRGSNKQSALPQ
ncbi:hypothetical protein BDL97_15G016600 [Sphagnum fallax]|jgi:hypothetical protein|nr:hypothetical protein BDL97_15G016600 [Sphagnum fallax]